VVEEAAGAAATGAAAELQTNEPTHEKMEALKGFVEAFPETLADAFPQPYRLVSVGATELDVVMTSPAARVPPVLVVPTVPGEATSSEAEAELRLDALCGDVQQVQESELWPRAVGRDSLLAVMPSVALKEYDVSYEPNDRQGFREVDAVVDLNARNSTSLQRAPAGRDEFVRGSRKNVPFLPGGMSEKKRDESQHAPRVNMTVTERVEAADLTQFASDMSTVVRFESDGRLAEPTAEELEEASATLSSAHNRPNFLSSTANKSDKRNVEVVAATKKVQGVTAEEYSATFKVAAGAIAIEPEADKKAEPLQELLGGFVDPLTMQPGAGAEDDVFRSAPPPKAASFAAAAAPIAVATPSVKAVEWAVMERLDVSNFRELVPNMAIEVRFVFFSFLY
jgi:hypothetical protein